MKAGAPKAMEEAPRRGFLGGSETARRRAARLIAVVVDALQIIVFPAFFPGLVSPFENALDVATGIILTLLPGWCRLPPTFIAEMVPSWTSSQLDARGPIRDAEEAPQGVSVIAKTGMTARV